MDPEDKKEDDIQLKKSVLQRNAIRSDEVDNRARKSYSMSNQDPAKISDSANRNVSINDRQSYGGFLEEKKQKPESDKKAKKSMIIAQKTSFVRAIYSIVLCQVILTFILSYLASGYESLDRAFNNIIVIILSYIILLGCLMVFFLTNISQVMPLNYILLAIFTVSESVVIAGWTSDMSQDTIILCVGMCMGTTGILTFKIFTMKETSESQGLFYTLVFAVIVQTLLAAYLLTMSYWKLGAVCFGVLGYG